MVRADLHLHSKYSDVPSTLLHQWANTGESFTTPIEVYRQAKKRGMDFVTITDHDAIGGGLELQALSPKDTFVSVEVTSYFPEDGCKAHILVYGLTEAQFLDINRFRKNIYDLRDYLREQDLTHALAHASYDMNEKLTYEHMEKYLLMFDVFEGRNGGRNKHSNEGIYHYLRKLSKEMIDNIREKHPHIKPTSDDPWIKGLTGGSDDHAGILIGTTYTEANTNDETVDAFLKSIRKRKTKCGGIHGDFQSYSIGGIKIFHDLARDRKKEKYDKTAIGAMFNHFFYNESFGWMMELKIKAYLNKLKKTNPVLHEPAKQLFQQLKRVRKIPLEQKLYQQYDRIVDFTDALSLNVAEAVLQDFKNGQIGKVITGLSKIFPYIFISMPFISSAAFLNKDRWLIQELDAIRNKKKSEGKSVLWFTDTIEDLNGPSVFLKKMARMAYIQGREMKLVSCLYDDQSKSDLPPNLIKLPPIQAFPLPKYENVKVHVPSLLKSLRILLEESPTEIVISTPGPVGWIGLLVAKFFKIPTVGVYHTDFTMQAKRILGPSKMVDWIEKYSQFFYDKVSMIRVPSSYYIEELKHRGLKHKEMKVFERGMDTKLYKPDDTAYLKLLKKHKLNDGFTLLYAGRVSEDKNMDTLLGAYDRLMDKGLSVNLVIAGDGPYLKSIKDRYAGVKNVLFTGRLKAEELPFYYAASDLLVFPSETDTFGMVVFEAQSCGLPALVSNVGGPKEVIQPNVTGFIVKDRSPQAWYDAILRIIELKESDEVSYRQLRTDSRTRILENNDWDKVLDNFLGRPRKHKKVKDDLDSSSQLQFIDS